MLTPWERTDLRYLCLSSRSICNTAGRRRVLRTQEERLGCTSTTSNVDLPIYTLCISPVGWRYVSGGNSTSASLGKAESHPRLAPRTIALSTLILNRRVPLETPYAAATASEVDVDIGASSVPPIRRSIKSSVSRRLRIPRQRFSCSVPSPEMARTARRRRMPSEMNQVVRARG
eukprot:scaffold107269_cov34-Tisochrysis_lutea.AAC.2